MYVEAVRVPDLLLSSSFNLTLCIPTWQENFEAHKMNAKDMMFQVHLRAMQIDAEYEMADKNIEDAM